MEVEEPRLGIRKGTIPGSKNVYYKEVLNEDGTLLDNVRLAKVFHNHGLDTIKTTTVYSGSGIGASVVELALSCLGNDNVSLFVGSWAQYAREEEPDLASGHWNTPGK